MPVFDPIVQGTARSWIHKPFAVRTGQGYSWPSTDWRCVRYVSLCEARVCVFAVPYT